MQGVGRAGKGGGSRAVSDVRLLGCTRYRGAREMAQKTPLISHELDLYLGF